MEDSIVTARGNLVKNPKQNVEVIEVTSYHWFYCDLKRKKSSTEVGLINPS